MAGRPSSDRRLNSGDRVVLDGRDVTRLLAVERNLKVIAYHKPTGEMLRRRAGDEREGVEMHLPALHAGRWVAINALGFGEDGLLLLASEGPFALAIARRGHELGVEYRVRALRPSPEAGVARASSRSGPCTRNRNFFRSRARGRQRVQHVVQGRRRSNGASRRDPRAVRRRRAESQSRDAREMGTDRAATRPATRPQPCARRAGSGSPLRARWAWHGRTAQEKIRARDEASAAGPASQAHYCCASNRQPLTSRLSGPSR